MVLLWDMREGLTTTVLGMGVVFLALILLWAILEFTGKLFQTRPAAPAAAPQEGSTASEPMAPLPAPVMAASPAATPNADLALIAVIAAAIAAHTGRSPASIKISSIRRLVNVDSGWAGEARRDLVAARQALGNE